MKKLAAFALAVVVALAMTACGGRDKDERETAVPAVSDVLVRSVYNEIDASYYNSYTQLTVTPPGDWYVYTDNDLAMSFLGGKVTGDEFSMWSSADYKNRQIIPDFAVMDMANNNSLSVVYVNRKQLENAEHMDEDAVRSLIIQSMVDQGRILQQRDEQLTLCGQEFRVLEFKGTDATRFFATRIQDNYMIVITATDRSGAGAEMFFSFF